MKLFTAAVTLALITISSASYAECVGSEFACARIKEVTAARNAEDDAKCRSYGAKPGSQAYVQCRLVLNRERDNYDANQRAETAQRAQEMEIDAARQNCRWRGLMIAGAAMMQGKDVPAMSCP
jgi:hypothetical protein